MKLKARPPCSGSGPTPDPDGRLALGAAGGQPGRPSSGITFKAGVLREQMRLRGLSGAALARLARVSDATISNALAGRRLHPDTFRRIAGALAAVALVPGMDALAELRETAAL
jgi:hypothetical protein